MGSVRDPQTHTPSGAHYQERDSAILGLSISTVAKVSIFRFPFSAKQTKGVLSGQSQYEILLRHSWHSFLFTKKMADESTRCRQLVREFLVKL